MVVERAETLKNETFDYAQTSIFLVLRNAYPNKTTIFVSQNLFTKNNSPMKPLITVVRRYARVTRRINDEQKKYETQNLTWTNVDFKLDIWTKSTNHKD